jgi:GTPase KRas protein
LEDERQVTTQEATALAKSWVVPFFEASALARINVEESFFELVREIRKTGRPIGDNNKGKGKSGAGGRKGGQCNLF